MPASRTRQRLDTVLISPPKLETCVREWLLNTGNRVGDLAPAGVSRATTYAALSNARKRGNLRLKTAARLADALGVSLSEILP